MMVSDLGRACGKQPVMHTDSQYEAIVLVRELLSNITHGHFLTWWPGLTEEERDQYTVLGIHNMTSPGSLAEMRACVCYDALNAPVFSGWLAVGNFPAPHDEVGAGELLRVRPSAHLIDGNRLAVSAFFSGGQANGGLHRCGIFGSDATSTPGSGTLLAQALLSNYNKEPGQVVVLNYLFSLD